VEPVYIKKLKSTYNFLSVQLKSFRCILRGSSLVSDSTSDIYQWFFTVVHFCFSVAGVSEVSCKGTSLFWKTAAHLHFNDTVTQKEVFMAWYNK